MPPIDGLLFLQHRAGDRRLRNGGVLVSSQAGRLYFWSVTGQTHTYGEQEGWEGMFKESLWSEDKIGRALQLSGDGETPIPGSQQLHLFPYPIFA